MGLCASIPLQLRQKWLGRDGNARHTSEQYMSAMLPFDSHCHVHMGPSSPHQAFIGTNCDVSDASVSLSGMAIMSTHPRDFDRVLALQQELPKQIPNTKIVPCFGIHPWFLHELTEEDWRISFETETSQGLPRWLLEIEQVLIANPGSVVGEIGLDGFHFSPDTEELVSSMEDQIQAFTMQLELAARLERPVSIHAVRCFGPLMESLSHMKKRLPPQLYFHAFGGKSGTIDQLLAICGREQGRVYFGFAPFVNFRSPKTADIIRKVGLDRLVLETDHEDAALVLESMDAGIRYIAAALSVPEEEVIERTTLNAFNLYSLS